MANLVRLRTTLGLRAPSIFLLWHSGSPWDSVVAGDELRDYAYYASAVGLHEVAGADVDGIGPEMTMVISQDADGSMGEDTGLVARAHAAGLAVHPYTFRAENMFLYGDFRTGEDLVGRGDLQGQIMAFLEVGVDGFFTDQADLGVAAVQAWTRRG